MHEVPYHMDREVRRTSLIATTPEPPTRSLLVCRAVRTFKSGLSLGVSLLSSLPFWTVDDRPGMGLTNETQSVRE
jgi:hypothetical protein